MIAGGLPDFIAISQFLGRQTFDPVLARRLQALCAIEPIVRPVLGTVPTHAGNANRRTTDRAVRGRLLWAGRLFRCASAAAFEIGFDCRHRLTMSDTAQASVHKPCRSIPSAVGCRWLMSFRQSGQSNGYSMTVRAQRETPDLTARPGVFAS
jgi:hypothetical protein